MDRRAWDIRQEPFDPKILQEIRMFRIEDLSDNVLRENWFQVAKRFSKMKLLPEHIQRMSYEDFMTIRCIMSATLGDISRKTEIQREKIDKQEELYAKLKNEEEMLTQIYNDNVEKSKMVKMKVEKLKKEDEEDMFKDILDSQDNQKE